MTEEGYRFGTDRSHSSPRGPASPPRQPSGGGGGSRVLEPRGRRPGERGRDGFPGGRHACTVTSFRFLCLVTIACKRGANVEPSAGPKVVKCAPVQSATVTDSIEVRGTVAPLPDRDAQVAPQVGGRILRVEVREGDTVAAGQIVARIDDAPLVDAAHQADAALARARAELQNAQTTLARVRRVFEHGIAARQEVDDAAAKEASARAAEIEAEAAARQAHRQIERATVHSPLTGVVLKVLRKPGELVDGTPATPVVEIADTSELEARGESCLPRISCVSAVGRRPPSSSPPCPNDEFKASVARVAPSVDRATGIGTVRIAIARSDAVEPSRRNLRHRARRERRAASRHASPARQRFEASSGAKARSWSAAPTTSRTSAR